MTNISPERREQPRSWQTKRDVLLTSSLEYSYSELVKGGVSDFWTFFGTLEPTQSRFMFVNCAQRLLSCCCSVYIFSRMVAIRIRSTKTDILNSLSKDILNSLDR